MRMDKLGEFIEAYVKGEITEEGFEGWDELTYPRQLELKLGRLQYENAGLKTKLQAVKDNSSDAVITGREGSCEISTTRSSSMTKRTAGR